MKKELKKSKNRGITLVSLVITIIVLLILAGITLNLALGENGLLRRAEQSEQKYRNAQEDEKKDLDKLYSSILIATGEDATVNISMQELNELITLKVQEEMQKNVNSKLENIEKKLDEVKKIADNNSNIKVYRCENGTSFNDIKLETGDYKCIIFKYSYGTIEDKPNEYYISFGDNPDSYVARYYETINGDSNWNIEITPRSNENTYGSIKLSTAQEGWYQLIIIKLDKGHS